jgi:hypothetical protein
MDDEEYYKNEDKQQHVWYSEHNGQDLSMLKLAITMSKVEMGGEIDNVKV